MSTKSAKKAYLNNSFLQTHDIEWGDRTKPDASSLPGDFAGNYTSATLGAAPRGPVGSGVDSYAINGFEPGSVKMMTSSNKSEGGLGLFPQALDATFSNIKLGVIAKPETTVNTGGAQYLGFLVGQATRCSFGECQVIGGDQVIEVNSPSKEWMLVGGLVGRADACQVENCSVVSVKYAVISRARALYVGGLAGYFNGNLLLNCSVSNLELTTNAPAQVVGAGCLVGCSAAGKMEACSVSSVAIKSDGGSKGVSVAAGGLVGRAEGYEKSGDNVISGCYANRFQITVSSPESPSLACGGLVGSLLNYQIIGVPDNPLNPEGASVRSAKFTIASPVSQERTYFGGLVGSALSPSWIDAALISPFVYQTWFIVPEDTANPELLLMGGFAGKGKEGSMDGIATNNAFEEVWLFTATDNPQNPTPHKRANKLSGEDA